MQRPKVGLKCAVFLYHTFQGKISNAVLNMVTLEGGKHLCLHFWDRG